MDWTDWLPSAMRTRMEIRSLRQCARATWAEYNPQLEAEKKLHGDKSQEYLSLLGYAIHMSRQFTDEIQQIESKNLVAEANDYFLDLSDLAPPRLGDSHWEEGEWGDHFLSSEASSTLRKLVYKARREYSKERRERVVFWFSLLIGLFGMGMTVYNTFTGSGLSSLSNRVSALEKTVLRTNK